MFAAWVFWVLFVVCFGLVSVLLRFCGFGVVWVCFGFVCFGIVVLFVALVCVCSLLCCLLVVACFEFDFAVCGF